MLALHSIWNPAMKANPEKKDKTPNRAQSKNDEVTLYVSLALFPFDVSFLFCFVSFCCFFGLQRSAFLSIYLGCHRIPTVEKKDEKTSFIQLKMNKVLSFFIILVHRCWARVAYALVSIHLLNVSLLYRWIMNTALVFQKENINKWKHTTQLMWVACNCST